MGAGHTHALYVHEHSAVHRMAPEAKLLAALLIVSAIAVTPPEAGFICPKPKPAKLEASSRPR